MNSKHLQKLREQLIDEGLDEKLVRLVGTVPLRRDSYKAEIRATIYERYQRKLLRKQTQAWEGETPVEPHG